MCRMLFLLSFFLSRSDVDGAFFFDCHSFFRELKDNNETKWEPSAIAKHISPIVQKYDIDTVR